MGLLQRYLSAIKERKANFKQAQEERQIQRVLDEREKSHAQRELERYIKMQQEADFKEQLKKIHAKEHESYFKFPKGKPIGVKKNIFLPSEKKGFGQYNGRCKWLKA